MLEPRVDGREIGFETRVVSREQRDPRGKEAQLQVLAQEVLLLRGHQRRRGPVRDLDPDQLLRIGPDFPQQTAPRRIVGRRGRLVRRGRRHPLVHRERQRVDGGDRLVELQAHADDVHVRHGLQAIHVARQRAAQRHELRAVEALQLGVGELERGERGRDVARELQLLARDQEHLLDLGDRDLVPRRREVAVERLQRRLLGLRLREPRLEERDFCLGVAQVRRELRLRAGGGLRGRFDGGQTLRHLDAQRLLRALAVEPEQRSGGDGDGEDADQHRQRDAAPRALPFDVRRDALGRRPARRPGDFGRVPFLTGGGRWAVVGIGHERRR